MMLNNLRLILSESFKWRNRELLVANDFVEARLTFGIFLRKNAILLILGAGFSICFSTLINKDFAANMVTALSVFIGLFTTTLILIFDKYLTNFKVNTDKGNSKESRGLVVPDDIDTNLLRTKNFSERFVYVSLESLLIAIFLVILLMLPMMIGEKFEVTLLDFKFKFSQLEWRDVLLFLNNSLIFLTRLLLFILLYKYFKYMLFIFGALAEYLKGIFEDNIKQKTG